MNSRETVDRLLMSDHARELDDERRDRASWRVAAAEIAVSIILIVSVVSVFGVIEAGSHVGLWGGR